MTISNIMLSAEDEGEFAQLASYSIRLGQSNIQFAPEYQTSARYLN